ncbi:DUF2309 domain-containing protein [Natronococcus sp. A-GB1]|uniref:DUF2309 domain-containing protein n=1 Tax=Natronococcus sp. A-GB1 TaxID=3037648 RepID=UPI00241E47C8|nr:DUF2309 domain-containing protein [Natronococcus sp. A-GB1]MDG5757817.1 DUF2309 domain-containing protein [Natronococcus sp. A-GB1]
MTPKETQTQTRTATQNRIVERIDSVADRIGSVWPLHSFVTANPLSGFEDRPFHEAVAEGERLFGGRGYPRPEIFRRAWEDGRINPEILRAELAAHELDDDPETLLETLAERETERDNETDDATETVDRVLAKWLAAFLDQDHANWSMPNREKGFYAAWRELAPYDGDVPGCDEPDDLPETAMAVLEDALGETPDPRWDDVLEFHLAALSGWTGFIKQRTADDSDPWQSEYPITLPEYLAVRLALCDLLDAPIEPADAGGDDPASTADEDVPLEEIWLSAWEQSYRRRLLEDVDDSVTESSHGGDERPDAQLVFCIDTRSEIIRRHIEAQGSYETHGYAGFFGIPMQYKEHDSKVVADACPPIVEPQHLIADEPETDHGEKTTTHDQWHGLVSATRKHFKRLKTNVVAAFPFVEGGGGAYGSVMAARTLAPSALYKLDTAVDERVPSTHEFCSPTLEYPRMSDDEKVEYAQTAFEFMGWTEFSRLVVFAGHASHTTNNPFDSSLDCGACAGNPGGPNARTLAKICNDESVKAELRQRGFSIPEDTVFVGAEHNTTTDEITLFDGDVPESHHEEIEKLRDDLEQARRAAAAERSESLTNADPSDPIRETARRAVDWGETRPEWGLAGNASFVIGPRGLTDDEDLDGRAFLHSYDWSTDPDGDALELIMAGPLVVTQWINNQYYFATVDNDVYGSGSKVTQNPVGNVGVVQGNGGDLMTGLPLQSLKAADDEPYHQPLRLTAVIHAPVDRVTEILREHETVERLVANGWIANLTVVDPTQDNRVFHYQGGLEWERPAPEPTPQQAGAPASSD